MNEVAVEPNDHIKDQRDNQAPLVKLGERGADEVLKCIGRMMESKGVIGVSCRRIICWIFWFKRKAYGLIWRKLWKKKQ